MDSIDILQLITRWLHILAAIALAGGTFFLRFSYLPAKATIPVDSSFQESIRKNWARLVMLSILFLLASGLYNSAVKAIDYQLDGLYLALLTIKIVLGLAVFFLVSVLSGRSRLARRFRDSELKWYNVTCVLMLAIVCIAGYMKLSPQQEKVRKQDADQVATVDFLERQGRQFFDRP